MRWDAVLAAVVAYLEADAALVAELGGPEIYPASASPTVVVPSVEWVVISDVEGETENAIRTQFDLWAGDAAQASRIEKRLRTLLHRETDGEIGGIRMAMQFEESRAADVPAELDPGTAHRQLDFLFGPARGKYL